MSVRILTPAETSNSRQSEPLPKQGKKLIKNNISWPSQSNSATEGSKPKQNREISRIKLNQYHSTAVSRLMQHWLANKCKTSSSYKLRQGTLPLRKVGGVGGGGSGSLWGEAGCVARCRQFLPHASPPEISVREAPFSSSSSLASSLS